MLKSIKTTTVTENLIEVNYLLERAPLLVFFAVFLFSFSLIPIEVNLLSMKRIILYDREFIFNFIPLDVRVTFDDQRAIKRVSFYRKRSFLCSFFGLLRDAIDETRGKNK